MDTKTRSRINKLKAFIRGRYAWPGGYDRVMICDDGAALCYDCVKSEYYNILRSTKFDTHDGWCFIGVMINYEEADWSCAHCDKPLSS